MRNLQDLGYFERQMLIDRLGRAIANSLGWQVDMNSNILESTNPRLRSYVEIAITTISEIEAYMSEISEEDEK